MFCFVVFGCQYLVQSIAWKSPCRDNSNSWVGADRRGRAKPRIRAAGVAKQRITNGSSGQLLYAKSPKWPIMCRLQPYSLTHPVLSTKRSPYRDGCKLPADGQARRLVWSWSCVHWVLWWLWVAVGPHSTLWPAALWQLALLLCSFGSCISVVFSCRFLLFLDCIAASILGWCFKSTHISGSSNIGSSLTPRTRLVHWICAVVTREKIISTLFQPLSTFVWSNFISARGNLPEISSKLFRRPIAAREYFPTRNTELISK